MQLCAARSHGGQGVPGRAVRGLRAHRPWVLRRARAVLGAGGTVAVTQLHAIELFPCAGGMALGFRAAGIEFALAVDKDPDACDSYEQNLGTRPIEMDVRDLLRLLPLLTPRHRFDLLVADPPCTPWSRAGKRQGLADERDMLRETVRAIEALRPRAWLIGNVPGLDDGPNWPTVQRVIGGIAGYCIDYIKLDAADYGVPQHRVRPFWFGHDPLRPCIQWPQPSHAAPHDIGHADLGDNRAPWVTCRDALRHLSLEQLGVPVRVRWKSESYAPSRMDEPGKIVPATQPGNRGAVLNVGHVNHRLSDPDAPARTLTQNTHGDGALLAHRRHPSSCADEPARTITAGDGGGSKGARCLLANDKHPINEPDAPSMTVTARDLGGAQGAAAITWPWDRPATTVTARDEIGQAHRNGRDGSSQSHNAVKLSERSGALLQGFPESAVFCGDTKRARWSQIGMAMPPPVSRRGRGVDRALVYRSARDAITGDVRVTKPRTCPACKGNIWDESTGHRHSARTLVCAKCALHVERLLASAASNNAFNRARGKWTQCTTSEASA